MVKEWESKNSIPDMFIDAGIFQRGIIKGVKKYIIIDSITGKISMWEHVPGRYKWEDPFCISLTDSFVEVNFSGNDIVEGGG